MGSEMCIRDRLRHVLLEANTQALPALCVISYLVFPAVSSLAFRAFSCDDFDDGSSYLQVCLCSPLHTQSGRIVHDLACPPRNCRTTMRSSAAATSTTSSVETPGLRSSSTPLVCQPGYMAPAPRRRGPASQTPEKPPGRRLERVSKRGLALLNLSLIHI